MLKAAAELDPENISVWLALGWCYKRVDHLDNAIQSLENALSADRQEAIIHYNLACYWSLAGNADRAIRYLSQSFDIDPQLSGAGGQRERISIPSATCPGFRNC